jgi:hypothetical protein
MTFDQLAEIIRQPVEYPSKEHCPFMKLAVFGDRRTDLRSLRHNANVISISGVEGDYDGEQVPLSEAAALLRAAGVKAILYTSPSHRPEAPRWRVLVPLSRPASPDARRALARVNGVLGGILSKESFTLSQSYYYGRVAGRDSYRGCNCATVRAALAAATGLLRRRRAARRRNGPLERTGLRGD